MLKKLYPILTSLILFSYGLKAQIIKGVVSDSSQTIIGATVTVNGQGLIAATNAQGSYQIKLKSAGTYTVTASYLGYQTQQKQVKVVGAETKEVNFTLSENKNDLDGIVVIGSRSAPRAQLETAVPVDLVDVKKVAQNAPQVSLSQILNYVAPSFTSNVANLTDGTDHIDPASLRGLGPDQVLVLINGKRRHTSSLININGSLGKGSVGTDLNAIPTAAIKRIEVLRDGAAAQYGSDAIAGVINIILNEDVNKLSTSFTGGGFAGKHSDGLDGQTAQANVNYGLKLNDKGGFLNLTGSFDYRDFASRTKPYSGVIFTQYNNTTLYPTPTGADITDAELARRGLTRADFVPNIGQSKNRGGALFLNAVVPVANNAEVYAFGGLNSRNGTSTAFYRTPRQLTQTNATIYPNGFLPQIVTDNSDQSLAIGIRGDLGAWKADFSNTYGRNQINFTTANTLNASMLNASPTSFDAGGYDFVQNTTNLDFARLFKNVFSGLNVAFGAEHRRENYKIIAGEEASYANYGNAINVGTTASPILIPNLKGNISTRFAANGSAYTGGAQGFPGFSPDNAINVNRSSVALYGDVEVNFTDKFLLDGAIRFENYSDFGSTLNFKVAGRYKFSGKFLLRGAVSTGFRAPSLQQRYFNATSTIFVDGAFVESGTFANDSRVAQLLGIPKLKEETSNSYSAGFTSNLGKLKITVDGYLIRIDNRVIYTGGFTGSNAPTASAQDQEIYALLRQANASTARFFANAVNTETKGIDAVFSYALSLGRGNLRTDLAGTISKTSLVGGINTSPLLAGKESTYLDNASVILLTKVVPRLKGNLTFDYSIDKFNVFLRNVYFGKVSQPTNVIANQQELTGRVITDLGLGYQLTKNFKLTVGANNIFDVYPEELLPASQGVSGILYPNQAPQFGFLGRYVFTRLNFNF
ncbi:TonB-dependent receptor [Pedobacter yonginense]|uniref:TonB-dependent receptor n=1 Tax=Pedobacter yonginense TaxID=651869 RepID=A0A317EJ16_9SPHI|nr:TonB-dependent receptor [Pedobacter yonginense]PWS26830.1 TonB-dependent receptor [Pedobacter yonginense]